MMAQTLLILFSLIALVTAISMLFLKHPMRVALALITTMLALGSIFAILEIHVLAVFQVLIYVGAIMVFMVYVIMLLDTKDTAYLKRYSAYAIAGSVLLLTTLIFFAPKLKLPILNSDTALASFSVTKFSQTFLTEYFLFFELSSVLLLVAVVCAVAVIKGRKNASN